MAGCSPGMPGTEVEGGGVCLWGGGGERLGLWVMSFASTWAAVAQRCAARLQVLASCCWSTGDARGGGVGARTDSEMLKGNGRAPQSSSSQRQRWARVEAGCLTSTELHAKPVLKMRATWSKVYTRGHWLDLAWMRGGR